MSAYPILASSRLPRKPVAVSRRRQPAALSFVKTSIMTALDVISIGPLSLALDRLVAAGLILVFLAGMGWIGRRYRVVSPYPAAMALGAGLIGARAAYVWLHRESFALDPFAAIQVWLGGWVWGAGVLTAALVLVALLRNLRAIMAGVGLLGALSAGWWAVMESRGSPAPILLPADMRFELAGGGAITLGQLRGRPAVLNLWATWCPSCRREMPMLAQAASKESRAALLMVNQGEPAAHVRAFLQRQALPAHHVALDEDGIVGAITATQAFPTTLFVGADGTIRQAHVGEISRVQLDIGIRALARQAAPAR